MLAAPTVTAAHLLFAAGMTAYILAAIRWEERDLVAAHPEYAAYRRRVPMLLPRLVVDPVPPAAVAGLLPATGEAGFTPAPSSAARPGRTLGVTVTGE